MMATTVKPPTKPPTMAPMGAWDDALVSITGGAGDVGAAGTVSLCVIKVVGEVDRDGVDELELGDGVEDDNGVGFVKDSDSKVELKKPVNVVKILPTFPA